MAKLVSTRQAGNYRTHRDIMRLMRTLDGTCIRRATLEEILEVRWVVLRPGRPRETAIFNGDEALATIHAGAFLDGRAIGCASLMQSPWEGRPAWQLRGMGVLAEHRGRGIGEAMLREVVDLARDASGIGTMWCNAREEAVEFYIKQGWAIVSEPFVIPDVGPHYKMIRATSAG